MKEPAAKTKLSSSSTRRPTTGAPSVCPPLPLISGLDTCKGSLLDKSEVHCLKSADDPGFAPSLQAQDRGNDELAATSATPTHAHASVLSDVSSLPSSALPAATTTTASATAPTASLFLQSVAEEPGFLGSSTEDCESLALVRAVIVLGLKSVRHRSPQGRDSSQPVELIFKGGSYQMPMDMLPRSAPVEGHEWTYREIRSCILQTLEELPEAMQPRCFLIHVWRANFTTSLRQICSLDTIICATAERHGWRLFKRGFSRGDRYLSLKEKRRQTIRKRALDSGKIVSIGRSAELERAAARSVPTTHVATRGDAGPQTSAGPAQQAPPMSCTRSRDGESPAAPSEKQPSWSTQTQGQGHAASDGRLPPVCAWSPHESRASGSMEPWTKPLRWDDFEHDVAPSATSGMLPTHASRHAPGLALSSLDSPLSGGAAIHYPEYSATVEADPGLSAAHHTREPGHQLSSASGTAAAAPSGEHRNQTNDAERSRLLRLFEQRQARTRAALAADFASARTASVAGLTLVVAGETHSVAGPADPHHTYAHAGLAPPRVHLASASESAFSAASPSLAPAMLSGMHWPRAALMSAPPGIPRQDHPLLTQSPTPMPSAPCTPEQEQGSRAWWDDGAGARNQLSGSGPSDVGRRQRGDNHGWSGGGTAAQTIADMDRFSSERAAASSRDLVASVAADPPQYSPGSLLSAPSGVRGTSTLSVAVSGWSDSLLSLLHSPAEHMPLPIPPGVMDSRSSYDPDTQHATSFTAQHRYQYRDPTSAVPELGPPASPLCLPGATQQAGTLRSARVGALPAPAVSVHDNAPASSIPAADPATGSVTDQWLYDFMDSIL